MKLRIHAGEVRLRLNREEVAQFSKMGFFEDSVEFAPGAKFCYSLESSLNVPAPQVVFQHGSLQVKVPNSLGMQWATSDEVGISADQPLANGHTLAILIEKDFKCIHSEHNDPHAYPNPLEDTSCRS